jgi:hypothetical protein
MAQVAPEAAVTSDSVTHQGCGEVLDCKDLGSW